MIAKILALAMFVAALVIAWFLIAATGARAHEAPTGWAYPTTCCTKLDCREVAESAISEPTRERQTFIIKRTGEQIIPTDSRIRPSPDGRFHWCSVQGADNTRTICLFVPPKGF